MKKNRIFFSNYLLYLIFLFGLSATIKAQSFNVYSDLNQDQISDELPNKFITRDASALINPKDTGDIVHYIPTQSSYCQGLSWDGTYLWCSEILWGKIYQLNPENGSVIKSFSAPGNYVEGLSWDGTYLWAVDNDGGPYEANVLYKLDPDDGSIVNSFELAGLVWVHGITWDGQNLWVIDFDTHLIHKVDPGSGDILSSIPAPGEKCIGLTWDGAHLWTDDFDTDKLYCLNPENGFVVYEVNSPNTNPRDLAWDGQYLWVMASVSSLIYQMDVGYITNVFENDYLLKNISSLSLRPNPASIEMNIHFCLKEKTKMEIEIFNVHGNKVLSIADRDFLAGNNTIRWNRNLSNQSLIPGVYFCRINSGKQRITEKFILTE
jgi:glutamine cyclotransferase